MKFREIKPTDLKVGMEVSLSHWKAGCNVRITAIGESKFLAKPLFDSTYWTAREESSFRLDRLDGNYWGIWEKEKYKVVWLQHDRWHISNEYYKSLEEFWKCIKAESVTHAILLNKDKITKRTGEKCPDNLTYNYVSDGLPTNSNFCTYCGEKLK